MNLNQLIRPHLRDIKPYSSARDEFSGSSAIFLDANESPFSNGVNRYPDPYSTELREVLASQKGLNVDQIMLGNGSDEILDLLFRGFCEPQEDQVIISSPTYGMYKVLGDINNVEVIDVPLNEDFSLNTKDIAMKATKSTKLLFICNPNNPTGNSFSIEEIEHLIFTFPGLVVLDEAYIDFSPNNSFINYLSKCSNLIVIQTFSKSFGAAGIRLGMLFANPSIIQFLLKIKPPYNVNQLSQRKGLDIIKDEQILERNISEIRNNKKELIRALNVFDFVIHIYPSDTNFLLVKVKDAYSLYAYLVKHNVIVRNRSNQLNCQNTLRVTVGTIEENQRLIILLKEWK